MSFSINKIEARIVDHAVRQEGAIVSSLGRHEQAIALQQVISHTLR